MDDIKERVIDTMFDRWCGQTDYEPESKEAMRRAIEEPNEDTIFQAVAITEAKSYKQGFRDCLALIKELFH